MIKKISCSLCGENKFTEVYSQTNTQILKCQNCGLIFRFPLPTRQEIQDFYDEKTHLENKYFSGLKKGYNLKNPAVKLYEKELKKIDRMVKPTKVLDIGCAYGVFLDLARKHGWDPFGVEISKESSLYAKKEFKLPVFRGTLEEAKFSVNIFGLVTMWDLIEHLTDPLGTLKEVNRILKKGGIILILTINMDSLMAKTANINSNTKDFLYDKQHNYFYKNQTLIGMLKKSGFKDIETLDMSGAQIERWQSRKIPYIFQLGVDVLDLISKVLNLEYRQIVIARK